MAISDEKLKIVINNYFKSECDVNTSIREAFEKGFRIGVKKGLMQIGADRKTENSSEKPNNCENDEYWKHLFIEVAEGRMSDAGANQAWYEYINHKDEPQTDCNGCKFVGTYDTEFPCANCSRKTKDYYAKDEPLKGSKRLLKGYLVKTPHKSRDSHEKEDEPQTTMDCSKCRYFTDGGERCDLCALGIMDKPTDGKE